tara:strand:- start:1110 stop:2069 length:960 start_codon:yes stop_codon:yes gene_type:complete
MEPLTEKKRRGRKSKSVENQNKTNITLENSEETEKIPKKRGRKPKGGKVISQLTNTEISIDTKTNVILHLKCGKNDLSNTESNNLDSFNFNYNKNVNLNYLSIENNFSNCESNPNSLNSNNKGNECLEICDSKLIYQKLEKLSNSLHLDNVCDKKSACFFCTCEFDNQPIFIPKFKLNNIYHVYGCFCSPECACAYLMNDKNIDSTTRFERYYLLNYIYCKIYNYDKNIKPAPSPFYTLDKYYGNLSIQEYRKLLKNERLLLVVDKPLVRSMPELHDDSDDYLLNTNGIPSGIHKYIPQKQTKSISKNDIVNENFNIKI